MPGVVLVVGATGVLAPAVVTLTSSGARVLAVARTTAALTRLADSAGPQVRTLAADATAPGFAAVLADAVDGEPLAGALLYGPATTVDVVDDVAGLSAGPVVHVLPSAAAAPDAALPPATPGVRRLLLGWRTDRTWHDAADISREAVATLTAPDDADRVLGVVRPWAERPL